MASNAVLPSVIVLCKYGALFVCSNYTNVFMIIFIIEYSLQNIPQLGVKLRKNVRCAWYCNGLEGNTELRLKKGVFLCVIALIRQFVV